MTFASTTPRRPISYEWSSLPVELRLQILGYVAGEQKSRTTGLVPYACVSSEWQDYFERFTFRRLLIDNSQLVRFSKITEGEKAARLSYIRYLCLRIKLQDYDYPECNKPESHATINWNNQRFTHSLKVLFDVLRRWEPSNHKDTGLILEITAYSPGDNEYCDQAAMEYDLHDNFQLKEDLESSPSMREFIRAKKASNMLVPGKNWLRQKTMQGRWRLQGTPLQLTTRKQLKQVPIVHTLWLRHQFYRGIADSTLVRILGTALTNVISFRVETASGIGALHRHFSDWNNLILRLPHYIRRFSLNLVPRLYSQSHILFINATSGLEKSLAKKAHHLVSLCPPTGINPLEFMRHLRRTRQSQELEHGSKLKQLCLDVLNSHIAGSLLLQRQSESLLEESAAAARDLPNLQIMEIWWHNNINACIFRYELEKDQVTITWRVAGDWLDLTEGIRQQWARVAQRYNVDFLVKEEPLLRVEWRGIHIDGTATYRHLKLCDLAVDPVTLAILEEESIW